MIINFASVYKRHSALSYYVLGTGSAMQKLPFCFVEWDAIEKLIIKEYKVVEKMAYMG